jgi:hypothetical protein
MWLRTTPRYNDKRDMSSPETPIVACKDLEDQFLSLLPIARVFWLSCTPLWLETPLENRPH